MAHVFTALSGSQNKPPALPVVTDFLGKIAKGNNLLGFVIVKSNAEEGLY